MVWRKVICSLLFAFAGIVCRGQFFTYGDDPGRTRWSTVETRNYRIVYPRMLDSLALEYASNLEKYSIGAGNSAGFGTNQSYRRKMPVILHPFSSTANGVVSWTPRRMEFHTMQNPYGTEALPWIKELSIHESRHSAQMQYANSHGYRFFNILLGQLWPGAMASVYGNEALFEGDAVVAETALSEAGRGRTSDFLEYYRMAFDKGDFRDWYKWKYGSIKHYTPSYYGLGYITVSGVRTLYDDPMFVSRFYNNIFRNRFWPFPMFNIQHTVKEASGKNFKETFREIETDFNIHWREEALKRGEIMPGEQFTATPRRYREYSGTVAAGHRIFSVRSGMDTAAQLVEITDGERVVSSFGSGTSALQWSPVLGKIFWSERIPDPRWSLAGSSVIRYINPGNGRKGNLTQGGQRYFNPAPSPSDGRIAVTSYPFKGGSELVVLDGWTAESISAFPAPDGLQIVESAWSGDDIIVSGVSEDGFGLYLANRGFSTVLEPKHVKIKQLRSDDKGNVLFVCDRDGTDELYSFGIESRKLLKLSSVRYAASDFVFEGDSLYYSMLSGESRSIYRTALKDLPDQEADWNDTFAYRTADKLSEQEKKAGSLDNLPEASVSAPRKYSKVLHLARIHSWAPVYFDYDNITELSADISSYGISPGAIIFFQNDLGTSSGFAGYSYKRSKDGEALHSAHLKYTYSGLLPVIEAKFDYDNGGNICYNLTESADGKKYSSFVSSLYGDNHYLSTNLSAYIPVNLSSGGWNRGIIPQIKYNVSNNLFDTGTVHLQVPPHFGQSVSIFSNKEKDKVGYMQRLSASLRLYSVRNGYTSGIYPEFGIGLELGASSRLGIEEVYSPNAYAYSYAYLPGIVPEHGFKLSVLAQRHLGESKYDESFVNCLPRGFLNTPVQSKVIVGAPVQCLVSMDYGMNIAPVDWSFLCPAAYIRNLILKPHFDMAYFLYEDKADSIFSIGSEFSAALGNLLWLPFDCEIGLTYSFNGGKSFEDFKSTTVVDRHYVGMVFNIDFQ